jgi:hypothetical protein
MGRNASAGYKPAPLLFRLVDDKIGLHKRQDHDTEIMAGFPASGLQRYVSPQIRDPRKYRGRLKASLKMSQNNNPQEREIQIYRIKTE